MSDSLSHNYTRQSPTKISQNIDDIGELLDELDDLTKLKTPIFENKNVFDSLSAVDIESTSRKIKKDPDDNREICLEPEFHDWDLPSFSFDSPHSVVNVPCVQPSPPHEYINRPSRPCSLNVGQRLENYYVPPSQKLTMTSSVEISTSRGPSVKYVKLIAEAILSKDDKRMFLQQIYDYITENHKAYSQDSRGWKNSVRYNLSLNRCFVKTTLAGKRKGHWWTIHPVCIDAFKVGRFAPYRFPRKRKTITQKSKYQPREAIQMINTPLPFNSIIYSLRLTGPRDELYAQHQRAIETIMRQLTIKEELGSFECSCFKIKGQRVI